MSFLKEVADTLWDHLAVRVVSSDKVVCLHCGATWELDLYEEDFDLYDQTQGSGKCERAMYQA